MICSISRRQPTHRHRPPLSMGSGPRQGSDIDSVGMSTPFWAVVPERSMQYAQRTEPMSFPDQTGSERPRIDPGWQSVNLQSPWPPGSDHLQSPRPSEAHIRRPSSSAGVLTAGEWYRNPVFPIEQYAPASMYATVRPVRSSSQPGRPIDFSQNNARPSLLRQTTEASPIQRQFWNESTFRGNADYQLFVEATFGISPEHPRQPGTASADYFDPEPRRRYLEDTAIPSPTAFRQSSRRALSPDESAASRAVSYSPPQRYHDAATPYQGPDEYSRTRRSQTLAASPRDDELPDYAQSQAEMQQQLRLEAVRRAQELQRRWRECQG